MKCGIVAVSVVLVLATSLPAQPAIAVSPILVLNEDFADPDVVATDDGYVAYSTSSSHGKIPVAQGESADGSWTVKGDALGVPPAWVDPQGGFWSPDVTPRADGGFLMYYSAIARANGRRCIGSAVSATVFGPFTSRESAPLVCEPADNGDIDPQSSIANDGTRYLLYKSNGAISGPPATIWSQRLSSDGRSVTGNRVQLLRAELPNERNVVEAPALVRLDGGTVLFYSADEFMSSGYHTSYAVASDPDGPYIKEEAPLLSTEGLGGAVEGPGGADVVADRIFFHGWLDGQRKARGLYVLPIRFDGVTPVIGDG